MLHAGSDVRVEVNIVGSQDTTGLMTAQELRMMEPDGDFSNCRWSVSVRLSHRFSLDKKAQANIPKLMKFMNDFGVITARDPKGEYHAMRDVIHKVLNDITGRRMGNHHREEILTQECLKVWLSEPDLWNGSFSFGNRQGFNANS